MRNRVANRIAVLMMALIVLSCRAWADCAHERRYRDYGEERVCALIPGDDACHSLSREVFLGEYCVDCGTELGRTVISSYAGREYHTYDEKGVCENCGYVNTCAHPSATTRRTFEEPAYTVIDGGAHRVRGILAEFDECDACHMILAVRKSGEEVTETQPHLFDQNGRCRACLYECAHDGGAAFFETDLPEPGRYLPLEGSYQYHMAVFASVRAEECGLCGFVIAHEDEILSVRCVRERHDFNDEGVCRACGAPFREGFSRDVSADVSRTRVRPGELVTVTVTAPDGEMAEIRVLRDGAPLLSFGLDPGILPPGAVIPLPRAGVYEIIAAVTFGDGTTAETAPLTVTCAE